MKRVIRFLRKIVTSINPELSSKIMYRKIMKKRLNLTNPKSFNEKINYLKLYKYPNNELIIKCTDKFLVRDYIKSKGLEKYLVNIFGCYEKAEDIEFEKLPKKFVLKCNHGCAYNILCKDKQSLNKEETINRLKRWLSEDFGLVSGEPHYSKIQRKIICEEYLEDDILDYKFFCFKGEPKFFYIAQNVNGDFHDLQQDFFYPNGKIADFYRTDHKRFKELPHIPNNLDEMLSIARILSKDFEFVRVDLFNVSGKIYFSELTFSPCSGFMPIIPQNKDFEFGNMIDIKK